MPSDFATVEAKVIAGERLDRADARVLISHPDLTQLGALADLVRRRLHPEPIVSYVVGRNINYTNVCWVQCGFCAFYRRPDDKTGEAYTLAQEELHAKVEELLAVGEPEGQVELLLQGGLNPKLKIDWYEDVFRDLRAKYPRAWLHALSVTEILYIAKISGLSVRETIARLQAAGLGSIPGAGAELLDDEVRARVAPHKEMTAEWLDTMRIAHELGLRTSATMMYGVGEPLEARLNHLFALRDLQDETGGFSAFIAWNFQPEATPLGESLGYAKTSGYDYLRTIATARLVLDNFANLQASWVTQGPKIAQISLRFGVNDFGSTMLEENVVSAAGTDFTDDLPLSEMTRLIEDAGYEARRRTTLYDWV